MIIRNPDKQTDEQMAKNYDVFWKIMCFGGTFYEKCHGEVELWSAA